MESESAPFDNGTLQAETPRDDSPSLSQTEEGISSSKQQILIDRYVPIAGILFLAILFIVCIIGLRKK